MTVRCEEKVFIPTYVDQTVAWAIQQSKDNAGGGSDYAAITACTFTSFMFDGVIQSLGSILLSDWIVRDDKGNAIKKDSKSFCGIDVNHKRIRNEIELDNSGADYQDVAKVVRQLIDYRDVIAHPKIIQDEKTNEWKAITNDIEQVESWYRFLREYSIALLKEAANVIETHYQEDKVGFYNKYPHLKDRDIKDIIHTLKTFFSFSEQYSEIA